MIRKLLFTGAMAAALILSGCVSVPMASKSEDAQAKLFAPTTNQAALYIYRNESMGGAIKMPVLVDGVLVGDTGAKTYIYKTLEPGPHVITSKAEKDVTLNIDVQSGQTYYVWQEVKMGVWSARSALHLMDAQKGQEGVKQCSMVKAL